MSRAFRMLCRPVLLAVLISFPWLHSFVGESWTPQLAGRGVGRVERGDGSGNRDWSLFISAEEAATGLTEQTMAAAATLLNSTGFVVLQGASLFSELELQLGQETADVQLAKVTSAAERLDLLGRSPWVRGHNPRKLFEFQEALSYSQGRLDMPQLMGVPELRGSRWCDHSGLRGIAESAFGRRCEQSVLGALWNFPGSGPPVWHRDGFDNPLLVAVTAACDYPQTVGFIHGQPMSHNGARFSDSEGMKAPITSKGEVGVPLPLRRGETLLFFYTTKHAATPNLSNLDRCLLYSVHGPVGVRDEHNHKDFLPSLFELSKEEAKDLDAFYRHHLGI